MPGLYPARVLSRMLTQLLVPLQVGEVKPGPDSVQQQLVLQGKPVPIQVNIDRKRQLQEGSLDAALDVLWGAV